MDHGNYRANQSRDDLRCERVLPKLNQTQNLLLWPEKVYSLLLIMYVCFSWKETTNEQLNSLFHPVLPHIVNPKPCRNWNTCSLQRVLSRITQKTISLHCNIHLNAMVDSYGRLGRVALLTYFVYSVPSKLLSWITLATLKLENITNKGLMEGKCAITSHTLTKLYMKLIDGRGPEAEELATQLALSLSLIQGVALNHESSKLYLGRKCSLEVSIILFS